MNAGVPVVASDIPSQVETLRAGGGETVGRVLPVDDEAAWVREIGDLLRDPDRARRLATRANERAADFTIARMADGFERAILWSATPHSDLPAAPAATSLEH
jgi:glycosyltransferase involved in cell wall biosynthesis